jgi:Flp pilus assembly pilin Flp
MQTIARRTEETTRELGIQARLLLDNVRAALVERAREQRGQTAAEYMGILLVVAVIIGAIATSGIGGTISGLIGDMIDSVSKGDKKAPGAGQ